MNKRKIQKYIFKRRALAAPSLRSVLIMCNILMLAAFIIVRMGLTASLSNKGEALEQALNTRNALQSANRALEQETARNESLVIIQAYAEDELGFVKGDKNATHSVEYYNPTDSLASMRP